MTLESDNRDATQPLTGSGGVASGHVTPVSAGAVTAAGSFPSAQPSSRQAGRGGKITVVETHSRSVVKAISWRATGTLDTMVVSFLVTGRLKLALSIGFMELFTKIALYYLHERLWGKIRFGRVRVSEDYEI